MKAWWKSQAWVASTEVLMGFLAAWGLLQGVSTSSVTLGVGFCYAFSSISMAMTARQGRRAAMIVAALTIISALVSILMVSGVSWWSLCLAAGGLLSFRDQQSVRSLAWMPVRALRNGGSSLSALLASSLMGGVMLAICLVLAGFISQQWQSFPQVVAFVACLSLLPTQVWKTPVTPLPRAPINQERQKPLSWLLRLSLLFNAVNFLGRRIVLPVAILSIAQEQGWGADAMPLLGGILGFMGLLGIMARVPMKATRNLSGEAMLSWGARASLLGWVFIGTGAALLPSVGFAWISFLFGWVLLELTNKTWGTGYMEALRSQAIGGRLIASRAHRAALQDFMSFKSAGGAIGCSLAALLSPATAPWLVAALAAGCWVWLETPPKVAEPLAIEE